MTRSIRRDKLTAHLDEYLRVATIPDVSPNGLQVQGRAVIECVSLAVDASLQTIRAAVRRRSDFMIVHHGLWWGKHVQITGNQYERIAALIHGNLSLYAAHIPLDCHEEVGNNVQLARRFGLDVVEPFGEYRGIRIGVICAPRRPISRNTLARAITRQLGASPDVLAFGPDRIHRVAIVSGNGAMLAEPARKEGCDTLVTGESSHAAWHPAREAGINLVFAGHYATETVGLEALAEHLKQQFQIKNHFLSAPTGY